MSKQDNSRREFIKKVAYIPPAIVTLSVLPSYAKAGSDKPPRPPGPPPPPPPGPPPPPPPPRPK